MSKRNRDPVNDTTEEAFGACMALLEGEQVNIETWSMENRVKLADMLAIYLSKGQQDSNHNQHDADGGCCDQKVAGTGGSSSRATTMTTKDSTAAANAASTAQAPTVDSLFTHLSQAKDVLRGLVPVTDVDTKAQAPSYEEDTKTFEIDSFLFEDDDEVEESLVEPGHVARNYCTACGSHADVVPTRFISHSFSRHQLAYWFRFVIPQCVLPRLGGGKTTTTRKFLDVGSRFGVVPVAAALSLPQDQWTSIQGVEFNAKYCQLSEKLVQRLGGGGRPSSFGGAAPAGPPPGHWTGRISFHAIDALGPQGKQLMAESDLICFNNVFEWYSETEKLLQVWKEVRDSTKSTAGGVAAGGRKFIMTNPSLEESLGPLMGDSQPKVSNFMKGWVKEVDLSTIGLQFTREFFDADAQEPDEEFIEPLHLYEVITAK